LHLVLQVLPKCVQFLGGILGTLLLVAVAGLTFFTVHGGLLKQEVQTGMQDNRAATALVETGGGKATQWQLPACSKHQ
jgi:thiamine biosynthesis protein ThiC